VGDTSSLEVQDIRKPKWPSTAQLWGILFKSDPNDCSIPTYPHRVWIGIELTSTACGHRNALPSQAFMAREGTAVSRLDQLDGLLLC